MKILILEDNEERCKIFKRNLAVDGVVLEITDQADECIARLQAQAWDILFLDHDLGGDAYVDSFGAEKTGYTVACWLAENPTHVPNTIYLHSLNPTGRYNMKCKLPIAKELPFAWNIVKID